MDVHAFFVRYAERYMAGDAAAVADMYGAPFLAVRGGTPIHLADRHAVVEHLSALMAAYRNAGGAKAEIASIDLLPQGNAAQLATVHWAVRSIGGELIRDLWTSYQFAGPNPWRIVSYVNHDVVADPPAVT